MSIPGNFLSSTTESIDPNTSGWVAKLNCAISLGSGGRNGDGALKLTSNASGEMQARTFSSYAVTAGVTYQAFADASGVTVPERIGIRWLNSSNVEISITWSQSTATASATWHRISVGGPAPAGSARAQVVVSATPAAGAVINYFENVYLGFPITTVGNLLSFNAETGDIDASPWVSETNCTLARQAPMVQWPVDYYLAGGETIAATATASANAAFRCTERPAATAGVEYYAYCYLNPPTGASTTWVELRFYNGAGTQIQATRSTLAAPGTGWYREYASAVAPAGTATCSVAVGLDSATAAQVLRIDGVVIATAPVLVAGSVVPFADASFEQGVAGWTVPSGVAVLTRSTPWGAAAYVGSYAGSLTSATATASTVRSGRFALGATVPVPVGQSWRSEIRTNVSAGSWTIGVNLKWYNAANAVIQTDTGSPIAVPTPGWWTISADFTAPANATQAALEYVLTATAVSSTVRLDKASLRQVVAQVDVASHMDTGSITVTNRELDISQFITMYRVTDDGAKTLVRGASGLLSGTAITSDLLVVEDSEAPLGVPVHYYMEFRDSTGVIVGTRTSGTATIGLGDGNLIWLKDPGEPQRNLQLMVALAPDWTRPIEESVQRVKGRRNAVIFSGVRSGLEGNLTAWTRSDQERNDLHWLLDSGHILFLQANPGYGVDDMYVAVGAAPEARTGGIATDEWREWVLPLTQSDMPTTVGVAGSAGRTWQDILTGFATWADVQTAYATWEDVLFDRRSGA